MSLAARFEALRNLESADRPGERLSAQDRGRALERLLHDAFEAERLDPRIAYNNDGEQIDGSFVLNYRGFLLEAKWHSQKVPASAIYAFKGKVDGKLVGTLGLMLSVNGFSDEASDALATGKDINVLLADGHDLTAALSPQGSISSMIAVKVRAAIDSGAVNFAYRTIVDGIARDGGRDVRGHDPAAIVFVVEGDSDALIVGRLGHAVLTEAAAPPALRIETLPGYGVENAARVARSLRDALGPNALVGVVVDADAEDPEARQRRLGSHAALRGQEIPVVAVAPNVLGGWLGMPLTLDGRPSTDAVNGALADVDPVRLRRESRSFERFAELIERHARAKARTASL